MTDRPILFSAPMVRALLAGTKTQTRRLFKPQPTIHDSDDCSINGHRGSVDYLMRDIAPRFWARFAVGDRLWVKETWRGADEYDALKPSNFPDDRFGHRVRYEAGYGLGDWEDWPTGGVEGKIRVSIHMPRWASRLTLHVADVRVQRLQEIIADDAMEEGVVHDPVRFGATTPYGVELPASDMPEIAVGSVPAIAYKVLWQCLNGEESWHDNPWVVAVSFEVERANIVQARP